MVLADQGHGLGAVARLAHHLHAGGRPHHDREAAAHQGLVVGDHHPYGHRAPSGRSRSNSIHRQRGPDPEAARIGPASSVPPNRAARSRIPIRPWPLPVPAIGRGAPPPGPPGPRGPSSLTSMLSSPGR